ncbi:MAG: M23 family metallopeptidase, partial [Mycobacteriales bacterium]
MIVTTLALLICASSGQAAGIGNEDATPQMAASGYVRPVDGRVVTSFRPGEHRYTAGHRGVDLAAPAGTTVRAAGSGTVAAAGMVAGRPVVSIVHTGGLRTT